jgi:hypothetical protein
MKKIRIQIISVFIFSFFLLLSFGSGEKVCDCSKPSITIPSYANSFDDTKGNWKYLECEIAQSDEIAEKIHVYLYHNSKINKYRCELRYSWPGENCRLSSKSAGSDAITTADISDSDYKSGEWKEYSYWYSRTLQILMYQ